MNINEDLTLWGRKAINFLFVSNPVATSMGILVGMILHLAIGVFSPALQSFKSVNLAAIKLWHLLAVGVFSANLPSFLRRDEVDPALVKAIEKIDESLKLGRIDEWRARQIYEQLLRDVAKSAIEKSNQSKKSNEALDVLRSADSGEE